jgi:hypothetical protein
VTLRSEHTDACFEPKMTMVKTLEKTESVWIRFRKNSRRQQCLQPRRNHLLEKHYAPGELASVLGFAVFVQATGTGELGESRHIVRKEHRVMKQFLVAFVAVHRGPSLISPRADLEDGVPFRPVPIGRAPEEPLCDVMMLGCM